MLRNCRIAFSCLNEDKKYGIYLLKELIDAFPAASNSVIHSCAAYIVGHFPSLPCPHLMRQPFPHQRRDMSYPSKYLSVHCLFDEWVELLANSIYSKNAIREGQTLYIKLQACAEFAKLLNSEQWEHQVKDSDLLVGELFGVKASHSGKKIAWLNCATGQLKKTLFEPAINAPAILMGAIYNNQVVDIYNVLVGEVPSVQKLLTYDTILIPGSGNSVLNSIPEVDKMAENLMKAYRQSQTLKIVGICYGHQLLARQHGATLVKRNRAAGLENVRFNKQILSSFDFLAPLAKLNTNQLFLSQYHEDYVTSVPEGYLKLAQSSNAQVESFVSQNGRIFSTQFHPEYLQAYTRSYVQRLRVFYGDKQRQDFEYAYNSETLSEHNRHSEAVRECIMNFL